ncbi:MAG: DUF2809 domain-containing protein [Micropruina sp.]|uniref:ribosomal maturation YjgA family protein n=1 Tax=Micropruina sp. TaxID=2737536 RepID=UPI0039E54464
MLSSPRRRLIAAGLAVVTVLAGLAVRFALPSGEASDVAGDALYAVLIYLAVVFLVPRVRPAAVAAIAGSLCVAIELFQLTGLPHAWASGFPPIALVLGTGFDVRDIVVYVVAVAVVGLIDRFSRRTTT